MMVTLMNRGLLSIKSRKTPNSSYWTTELLERVFG